MSTGANGNPPVPTAPHGEALGARRRRVEWVDVDRRTWRVELAPQRVVLRSADDVIDLNASLWARDIYVANHGDGFIIRIETFEFAVRFIVSAEMAAPFLAHVGMQGEARAIPAEAPKETHGHAPLLWPKVSPLAVWALIFSALVFVPVLGLLPALATVILLTLHRRRVRRVPSWRHSRALCVAAFVFLTAGLLVSALSTWGILQHAGSISQHKVVGDSAQSGRNWGVIAGGIFVVLLSLTIHEAAHAITAWWAGDGLARSLGRVTLNPLAHIDPIGTVLLPLILVMAGGPVFGYARPVPVRVETLPRHRRAHILISIAGPGSNLLLAAASLMLLLTLGCLLRVAVPQATVTNFAAVDFTTGVSASGFAFAPVFGALCTILKLSFIINVFLAVFNLIPIPPLDGSWVLEHLFPNSLGRLYAVIRPYGFLVFLLAIYMGLFRYLIWPVAAVLLPAFMLLTASTGL